MNENVDQWISDVIAEARDDHPQLPANIVGRMELLLREDLSEKNMTPRSLKEVAGIILCEMAKSSTESEEPL